MAHSLLVDEDLVKVVRTTRSSGNISTQTDLMIKRDSFHGFSHRRVDWLDRGILVWWFTTMFGIGALFTGQMWGLIPLALGFSFTTLQLADPEVLTFQSPGKTHRLVIWRWGSNRLLTAASMDCLDHSVQGILHGHPLDTSELDEIAKSIDSDRRLAKQNAALKAEQRKAERQAAKALKAEQAAQAQQEAIAAQAMAQMVVPDTPNLPAPSDPPPSTLPPTSSPSESPSESPAPSSGLPPPSPPPSQMEMPPPPSSGLPPPSPPPSQMEMPPPPSSSPPPPSPPPSQMGMPPPPLGAHPAPIDSVDLGVAPSVSPPATVVAAGERVDTMSPDEKNELLSTLGD